MKKTLTITIFISLFIFSGCANNFSNQKTLENDKIGVEGGEYQEDKKDNIQVKKTGSISIIYPSVNFGQKVSLDKNYYPEKYDIKCKYNGDINHFAFKLKDSKGIQWEEEGQNCEVSLPIHKFDFDDFDSEVELIFEGYYMDQDYKKELLFENKLVGVIREEKQNELDDNTNINYENEKYEFSLTFPKTWKNYSTNTREKSKIPPNTLEIIGFGFDSDEVFSINIHNKNQWETIKSEIGLKPTYIIENNNYVFSYSVSQDAFLVERASEVKNIIKTFSLQKNIF